MRKRREYIFNYNRYLRNGQRVIVRYNPLLGTRFDHQRRKVISDFTRFADGISTYKRAFDLDTLPAPVCNAWERVHETLGRRAKKENNISRTTCPTVQSSSE